MDDPQTIRSFDYFRCSGAAHAAAGPNGHLSSREGYFTFRDAVCYGRLAAGATSDHVTASLVDAFDAAEINSQHVRLPFDLSEIVTNLRQEQYRQNGHSVLDRLTAGSRRSDACTTSFGPCCESACASTCRRFA